MNNIASQLRSMKNSAQAGSLSASEKLTAKRAMLSAIGADITAMELSKATAKINFSYTFWLSRSFVSGPIAVGVASVVLATSGLMTTVSAAQESVPGEVLYSLKRINEQAQIQLASLDRKAILHTEFAERRLQEVAKLQADDSTKNSSLVTDTMNDYTSEVASANKNLQELQATGNSGTVSTANAVNQKLAMLNSTIVNSATPITSIDGSVAVSTAQDTTQTMQDNSVAVAMQAQQTNVTDASSADLQAIFLRQFASISTRKTFDLHRITVIRAMLATHGDVLGSLNLIAVSDLDRLERSINIAVADIAPAMDQFSSNNYRSAFEVLKRANNILKGIEATIADTEIAITDLVLTPAVVDPIVPVTDPPIIDTPQP